LNLPVAGEPFDAVASVSAYPTSGHPFCRLERIGNILIDHIHETLGHFGHKKTVSSVYRHFFWRTPVTDVVNRSIMDVIDEIVAKSFETTARGKWVP
jgi:hypothetical protein